MMVNAGRLRTVWLCGLAAASIAAPLAHAQDAPAPGSGSAPIITPPPSVRPQPQQLPGVIPERFSIAPAPSPTPAPVPTPTPTPAARTATPQPQPQRAAPVARATPAPREAAPVAASPTPSATPAPTAMPSPVAQPIPAPQPVQTAVPVPEPASASSPWLWAAAGAGGTALLGLGGWLLLGRRRREEDEAEAYEAEPMAVAAPPLQPPPGLGRATPAPVPAPAQPAIPAPALVGTEPFELGINPHRIVFGENEVLVEFELLIANGTGAAADSIRVAYAAMSAHARQDEVIAGFHGGPPGEPGGPPFDLPAGGGGRMPVRLAIPRSGVNVVDVGGRPMFVPIVLIDLRWRGGLSIRRFGADFILGTAGQGDKLGPIWLDRPAPTGQLAANRYLAKQMAAA